MVKMYKSTYLTHRVHTAEEANQIVPEDTVDLMLWLIDVYDIKDGCQPAVHKVLMRVYHNEQERVPGILPRWTKSMLVWVTLLHCQSVSDVVLNTGWARSVNLLPSVNEKWTAEEMLILLDALAMRWQHMKPCQELYTFLQVVWQRCRHFTLHHFTVGGSAFESVRDTEWFALKPVSVMAMMSRYYWFNQTLAQLKWFPLCVAPPLKHYFNRFIGKQKRHLKISKFRDKLTKLAWRHELCYGDLEIATHDQLGDILSPYSCLYKRRPICLMQRYQHVLMYGTYDELCVRFKNVLWILLVHVYFVNNLQIDFMKFFVCWESDQHKHRAALQSASVPIILERFKSFSVLHNGVVYGNGDISEIFPLWVHFAEQPYGCPTEVLSDLLFNNAAVETLNILQ